jgi:hypothetical protein
MTFLFTKNKSRFAVAGLMVALAIVVASCGHNNQQAAQVAAADACPSPTDTTIHGTEMDKWSRLDYNGDWKSQIHLETIKNSEAYHHVKWDLSKNRQTCSSGHISIEDEGTRNYLLISKKKTAIHMVVEPGNNYIDYTAYGCKTYGDSSCADVIETGTIVLFIDYHNN